MPRWSIFFDSMLQAFKKYEQNEELLVRILDILIYLINFSERLKKELVEHGAIRVTLSKINEESISF